MRREPTLADSVIAGGGACFESDRIVHRENGEGRLRLGAAAREADESESINYVELELFSRRVLRRDDSPKCGSPPPGTRSAMEHRFMNEWH